MKILCLDIKHSGIYAVVVNKTKRDISILASEKLDIPLNQFLHQPKAMYCQIEPIFKKFHRLFGWQKKIAAICLPSSLSIMQKICLPSALSDEDIMQEIKQHLKDRLILSDEPIAVDFIRINEPADHNKQDVNILFAAIREAHLTPWRELFQQYGFHLKLIDIDSYALSRIILCAASIDHTQIVASIVRQETIATCVVFNNEEMLFYETWDYPNNLSSTKHATPFIGQGKWLSLHAVQRIFLYEGQGIEKNMLVDEKNGKQIEICNLNWKQLFKQKVCHDNAQPGYELSSEYIFACGLSLREIPAW